LPNKHQAARETFWDGHLLESETYVGGHVESIEAGVFRSDIPCNFSIDTSAIDELIRDLDAALKFCVTVEEKKSLADIDNFEEVKEEITARLMQLKATPHRSERPLIYHLDVASMYPNIMTTNRLQPDSMIKESDCAACDFNRPGKTCDRRLPWSWRGEFLPAKRDEYNMIRHALEAERFPPKRIGQPLRSWTDLTADEQAGLVKKRLQEYSKKIYHKIHDARTIEREAIICQRENPFYVDTVKDFRDRRYDFKGKQKVWKGKTEDLKKAGAGAAEIEEAKKMIVLYDSLQLAHKVILNSFYGYVMRKGSRWYSLEMAGVTCLTGARIIQMARQLVERIGRPLELDTDGIWCILPATFPENYSFKLKNGKKVNISYPCVMLNHLVHDKFTNHQYQTLVDSKTFRYETHSDNTIFFEVDGPYKAMILPTSKEEDKNLKKRYAVFNHDGSLAELKGFEVKRRGELKLIKIFQEQIFKFFLQGSTLAETYTSVARVANRWLDVLHQQGSTLSDEELIDLICENKSMTKTLEEYGAQKSTAITTAKRLAEFLGEQMVKDKGLNCKYIISSRPKNAPVTERAVPVAIFSAEESVKKHFLRRWLRDDPGDMDPRSVIDWEYYLERLGSVIQKLITIPAALQKVRNPVPRVPHPDWLDRRIKMKEDKFQQKKMTEMFEKRVLDDLDTNILGNRTAVDLEDFGSTQRSLLVPKKVATVTKMAQKRKAPEPSVPVQTDPYASLPKQMPDISRDYQGWLRYQKQKWKIQKQARARRRQLFGEKQVDANDAIGSFFRNQAELLFISTWQVLSLRETDIPGEVRAFVLIDKKVHSIRVIVPRQIYLNLRSEDLPNVSIEGCKVEKVLNYTLPNGHPSTHLFKLTMPEQVFISASRSLSVLFNHPSVEGVYEKQVPLDVRALLQLGSVCTFDEKQKGVLGKGLEQGFDLSALRRVQSQSKYLENSPMTYLYLYHVEGSDWQIFALFSTTQARAHVIFMSRTKDSQGLPNLDKVYKEIFSDRLQQSHGEQWQDSLAYPTEIKFQTIRVSTKRKAFAELGDVVKKIKSEEVGPYVLVVQSPNDRMLSRDVPVIRDIPILPLRPDSSDRVTQALGWQSLMGRKIVEHYLDLGAWVSHLVQLARYGDIPICNLESNDPKFLIDVAYARQLLQEKVVLWWSSGAKPDHAGYQKDDLLGTLESVELPCLNSPGTYSSVCVDLSVRNLAINTVLSSSVMNEMEGSDSITFNPAAPTDEDKGLQVIYSDSAFASAGIMVLREMLKAWWLEAEKGSVMADVMVQHVVRWVESTSSYLYDHSLHYYVQVMSKKALQQLMSDFRRVGSNVVFANANRLILQTTKVEVGNAYAYSQYILKTVQAKPIFQFLDLEIREYWDYLVWYDEFNYGGKGCHEVVEAEQQTINTIMCWQFASFLPEILRQSFNDWVVEFINLMHDRKHPGVNGEADGARPTQLPFRPLTIDPTEETQFLPKTFSKPLHKQISALIKRQHTEVLHAELAPDWQFPTLPGSHLKLNNPVLQLVKTLMQVLSLDKTINLEARRLRKDLLNLFEIREFSSEASFKNPSASCYIRGLICDECTAMRDIDLCRDASLMPPPPTTEMPNPMMPKWKCDNCSSPFDRLRIEEMLVADVERLGVEWSTQDLKCSKCGKLRTNDFMEHCTCAGEWECTRKREDVRKRLDVLKSVADFYKMGMLESVVGEALEML
jgi:DNA polymerase epsilon subunit 1